MSLFLLFGLFLTALALIREEHLTLQAELTTEEADKEPAHPCVLEEGVEAAVDCKNGQRLALNLLALHTPETTLWGIKNMRQYLFPARYDVRKNWHKSTAHPMFLNLVRPHGVHPAEFVKERIYFAHVPPSILAPLPDESAWPRNPDEAILRVGGFVWSFMHEDINRAPIMIEMRAFVPPETKYASALILTKLAANPRTDTCKTWHPAIMPFFKDLARCWQPHEGARGCFVYGNEVRVIVGELESPTAFQPRFRLCVGSPCG